jgi:hypothetical protein
MSLTSSSVVASRGTAASIVGLVPSISAIALLTFGLHG